MAFLKKKVLKKEENTDARATRVVSDAVSHGGNNKIGILMHPHITEKTAAASALSGKKMYAFAVSGDANKHEVKQAVESRYNVKVTAVRVVNIRGKEIRRGKQIGWKQGMKKAYATLAVGQTIEIQ